MFGLGTIINTAAVLAGGICGQLFGRFFRQNQQETMMKACGAAVMFTGLGGALSEMLKIGANGLESGGAMLLTLSLVIGGLLGELIGIERGMERFGNWLKEKTGNSGETGFVSGFLSASFTICIGGMAVVGSIEDGISGNYSILATKGIMDFIIILIMTVSMGRGCVFSAIPLFLIQGLLTLTAVVIRPVLTVSALASLSMVGSVLIFCVGLNLVLDARIRVANLLPSLLAAVGLALLGM